MQWLRLYDDVLDDPKVQRLPPELFKQWINLLCLANKSTPRGAIPPIDDLAFRLRMTMDDTSRMLTELELRGLIDTETVPWKPHGWDQRQFKSDDVNSRVADHRARQKSPLKEETLPPEDDVTLHVTPPEQIQSRTDTEAEAEAEQSRAEHSGADAPVDADVPKKDVAERRRRIPENWTLSERLRAYAVEWGIPEGDVDALATEFKEFWHSDGRVKANWDLTFQGRVRDVAHRYRGRLTPNGTVPHQQTPEELAEFHAWMKENQPA